MRLLRFLFLFLLPTLCWAQTTPNTVFVDHLVMPRAQPWVFGSGTPPVSATFNGQNVLCTTNSIDKFGNTWYCKFPPMAADFVGQNLTLDSTIIAHDVLIGDDVLATGQSNMAYAKSNADLLQFFTSVRAFTYGSSSVAYSFKRWSDSTGIPAGPIVGTFFGIELSQRQHIPIGIISDYDDSTGISAFMGKSFANDNTELCDAVLRGTWGTTWGGFYNTSLYPLLPFYISAVVFFQGEANLQAPVNYACALPALVRSWNNDWGRAFPWILIDVPKGSGLNKLQASEQIFSNPSNVAFDVHNDDSFLNTYYQAMFKAPFTTALSTYDLTGGGIAAHPPALGEYGHRAAAIYLNQYTLVPRSEDDYIGPIIDQTLTTTDASGRVHLHVKGGTGTNLHAIWYDTANHPVVSVTGFTLTADTSSVRDNPVGVNATGWKPANACFSSDNNTCTGTGSNIIVWEGTITKPALVRYTNTNNRNWGNVFNAQGFGILPFVGPVPTINTTPLPTATNTPTPTGAPLPTFTATFTPTPAGCLSVIAGQLPVFHAGMDENNCVAPGCTMFDRTSNHFDGQYINDPPVFDLPGVVNTAVGWIPGDISNAVTSASPIEFQQVQMSMRVYILTSYTGGALVGNYYLASNPVGIAEYKLVWNSVNQLTCSVLLQGSPNCVEQNLSVDLNTNPPPAPLTDDNYHSIDCSYSNYTGLLTIWVDGQVMNSQGFGAGVGLCLIDPSQNPTIMIGNDPFGNQYYGSIDEVSVYNRPRSQDEVDAENQACLGIEPIQTPTPTVTQTPTVIITPTKTPIPAEDIQYSSDTKTPTISATPTVTRTVTPTVTFTSTITPTSTITLTPTTTPTITLTFTPSLTPSITPTRTSVPLGTPVQCITYTPSATMTGTLPPTPTSTPTNTAIPTDWCCSTGNSCTSGGHCPDSGIVVLDASCINLGCQTNTPTMTPLSTPTPLPPDTCVYCSQTNFCQENAPGYNPSHCVAILHGVCPQCFTPTPTMAPVKVFRIPRTGSVDLTSNRFEKQTTETYAIACTFQRQLAHNENILHQSVTVKKRGGNGCDPNVVTGEYIDDQRIIVTVHDGTDQCSYQLDLTALTTTGRSLTCSLLMDVKDAFLN